MSTKIIVSYDGTDNEDDAIALGALLRPGRRRGVARLRPPQPTRAGRRGGGSAELLARRGAELLGDTMCRRHVVTDRSTPEGLRALAERDGAEAIVFCSDSHTARATSPSATPLSACSTVGASRSRSPPPAWPRATG